MAVRSNSRSREIWVLLGHARMAEAVVSHFVAVLEQGLHQPGGLLHLLPQDKKGAVGLVQFEQSHDLRGIVEEGPSSKVRATAFSLGVPAHTVTGSAARTGPGRATREKNPEQRQDHPEIKAVKSPHDLIVLVTSEN